MNELIPITKTDGGVQAVMGSALHEFLEIETPYRIWLPRMVEYGFSEGQDYVNKNVQNPKGGRPRADHVVTLDMAKEVSMIQRNDKGKQARQYFIEVEKRAKSEPALSGKELLAAALIEAQDTMQELEARNKELEAPAKSWNVLADSSGDYSVSEAAKVLSRDPHITIGRDQLFAFMHKIGWLFRTRGHRSHWEASQQKAINTGRLAHKTGRPFLNEKTGEMENSNPTVRVTAKGLGELHQHLGGTAQIEIDGVAA